MAQCCKCGSTEHDTPYCKIPNVGTPVKVEKPAPPKIKGERSYYMAPAPCVGCKFRTYSITEFPCNDCWDADQYVKKPI